MKISELYDYENKVSEEKRTNLGIVYTPRDIVSFINEETLSLWKHSYPPKFFDPCCGTGVFIADMAKKVSERYSLPIEDVLREYAFGEDIDEDAIVVASRVMPEGNFKVSDSLMSDWSGYEIIVTNPPYIRIQNLEEKMRDHINENYSFCKGDTDIYMAFIEKMLASETISGFISPNSWIKNKSADVARREFASSGRVSTLVDFKSKKVFHNASTYTSILILDRERCEHLKVGNSTDEMRSIKQGEVFFGDCIITAEEDSLYYKEVQNRSHSLLDVFDIKTGLATLSDDVFCLEVLERGKILTRVKKRGTKNLEEFELESEILKPCIRAGDITKNAGKEYVMLYPYDDSEKPMGERQLFKNYPLAYSYLESNKCRLKKRDKGKDKGYTWVEYGRSQGLGLTNKKKLVFATMIKNGMVLKDCPPGTTFVSGYCFVNKKQVKDSVAKKLLASKDIMRWVKIFGKNFGDDWYGVSKQTFKRYKINL